MSVFTAIPNKQLINLPKGKYTYMCNITYKSTLFMFSSKDVKLFVN